MQGDVSICQEVIECGHHRPPDARGTGLAQELWVCSICALKKGQFCDGLGESF